MKTVRIKSLEDIKKIAIGGYDQSYTMPDGDGRGGISFVIDMQKYCGEQVQLKDWDGFKGRMKGFDNWMVCLPMIQEEHNRNGANS